MNHHHFHDTTSTHAYTAQQPHVSTHDGFTCDWHGANQACNQGMSGAIASGAVGGAVTGAMAGGVGAVHGAIAGSAVSGFTNCVGNVTNHLSGCW